MTKRALLLQPVPAISFPSRAIDTRDSLSRFERRTPLLLVVFAGMLALLPAIIFGIPANNDLANHYHFALPFYEAIRSGNLYPGWLASSNYGYGDPLFRFYPPGLYYLLAAGRILTGNWYVASLSVFTFLSVLGALGAYFWACSFLPRNVAVGAGVFYAFMPYHSAEIYQAAQLAEFAAGAALLFAFAFTKRLCQKGDWRGVAGLAISYGLLILCHLPLALFGSLAILVYALLSIERGRAQNTFFKLAAGTGLGLALSAFYWTRMVPELGWIIADGDHPDSLLDYRANFLFSTFSPEKNVTIWWMNLLAIATLAMALPAIILLARNLVAARNRDVRSVAVVTLFSLVMAISISKPLWSVIPYLRMAQHPFRWLSVTSATVPVLMAASLPLWFQIFRSNKRPLALLMGGVVLVSLTFTISQVIRGANYLSRSDFEQVLEPVKDAPSIIQWLPVWASDAAHGRASYEKSTPPGTPAGSVEAGERSITVDSWHPLQRTFQVGPGNPVQARVRTFYYPHWVATSNGKSLATHPADDGALLISLPAGSAAIKLDFREPTRARVSALVSAVSWTLLASLLIFGSFKPTGREHKST